MFKRITWAIGIFVVVVGAAGTVLFGNSVESATKSAINTFFEEKRVGQQIRDDVKAEIEKVPDRVRKLVDEQFSKGSKALSQKAEDEVGRVGVRVDSAVADANRRISVLRTQIESEVENARGRVNNEVTAAVESAIGKTLKRTISDSVEQIKNASIEDLIARGLLGKRGPMGPTGFAGPQGERGLQGPPGQIPAGAVIAFALSSSCPTGWQEYGPAVGRFIVGVNTDRRYGISDIPYETSGGEEAHTLSTAEMPRLETASYALNGSPLPWGPGTHPIPTTAARKGSEYDWGFGGNKPHNNMPPYIALYFCKKD